VYTDNISDSDLVQLADVRMIVIPRGKSGRRWGKIDAELLKL
jgi:hypothetical protein